MPRLSTFSQLSYFLSAVVSISELFLNSLKLLAQVFSFVSSPSACEHGSGSSSPAPGSLFPSWRSMQTSRRSLGERHSRTACLINFQGQMRSYVISQPAGSLWTHDTRISGGIFLFSFTSPEMEKSSSHQSLDLPVHCLGINDRRHLDPEMRIILNVVKNLNSHYPSTRIRIVPGSSPAA